MEKDYLKMFQKGLNRLFTNFLCSVKVNHLLYHDFYCVTERAKHRRNKTCGTFEIFYNLLINYMAIELPIVISLLCVKK